MANTLANAMEKVHLDSLALEDKDDNWIDNITQQQRPRKRVKQDPEELKRELEQKFLTPSNSFSIEWLNRLQQ